MSGSLDVVSNRFSMQQFVDNSKKLLKRSLSTGALLVCVSYVLFFLAFRWGIHFRIIDKVFAQDSYRFFSTFQADSDIFISGRLQQNLTSGVFSAGLSPGINGQYTSQFGLGGWILTLIPTWLGLEQSKGISLMFTAVAALNAAVASVSLAIVTRVLGYGAAFVAMVGLLQPWSAAMNHSIYWMIGLKVLPALVLVWLFSNRESTNSHLFLASFIFSALTFLSGYEYVTVVVSLQLGVVAYFSTCSEWNLAKTTRCLVSVIAGVLSAFVASLGLHFLQLWVRFQNFDAAIAKLLDTIVKNSGTTGYEVAVSRAESLSSNPGMVLDTYMSMPVIGAPSSFIFPQYLTVATLVVGVTLVMFSTFNIRNQSQRARNKQALAVAWFVTLLGPIGWFLLARPHSFIHTHINFAIWFLPTVPLGMAIAWAQISDGLSIMRKNRPVIIWVGGTVSALLMCYLYSSTTVR